MTLNSSNNNNDNNNSNNNNNNKDNNNNSNNNKTKITFLIPNLRLNNISFEVRFSERRTNPPV